MIDRPHGAEPPIRQPQCRVYEFKGRSFVFSDGKQKKHLSCRMFHLALTGTRRDRKDRGPVGCYGAQEPTRGDPGVRGASGRCRGRGFLECPWKIDFQAVASDVR